MPGEDARHYRLSLAIPDKRELISIQTAAMWDCSLCDQAIAGMGGPGHGELCLPCGNDLKAGRLRGTIKRRRTSA